METVRIWIDQWVGLTCPDGFLYAVENPAVFEELVDGMLAAGVQRAVVCTSGFLSAAAWRMRNLGKVGHQEAIIDRLMEDLIRGR